jgi:sugar phosphate permease
VLFAACGLGTVAYVHRLAFAAVAPDLRATLCLTDGDMGLLLAAFLLAYGAFEVPWGLVCDRFGSRLVLGGLALAWALVTGAVTLALMVPFAWALPFLVLLVLRFLFGFFQAGLYPGISRLVADWIPSAERDTAQGLVWTFSRFGGAVTPWLLLGLIWLLGNWQAALWALAVLGPLWVLIVLPWFRNKPEESPRVNHAERGLIAAGRLGRAAGPPVPWTVMLRSANVWALCAMYGFVGFSGNFFITFLPLYLSVYRKLPRTEVAWLSSLPLFCGVVGCVLGGALSEQIIRRTGSRKWGRRIGPMFGQAAAGGCLLSTIWVTDVWALGALLSLTFFFNDLAMGPAWAACVDIGERYAGTLGGKMNMVGNIAGAVGMVLTGFMLQQGYVAEVFVMYSCSYALAVLCWLRIDATEPLKA